ncbi:MAG: lipoprotein-releasing system permease protein [Flavobacteriales bacterium]|jgi:lipoprotein-releasing system permease protein
MPCRIYLQSTVANSSSFIAKRLIGGKGSRLSRPIVTIAMIAIALGVALMIVALSVLRGFQEEIKQKLIGFGAHIQVVSSDDNFSKESVRMRHDMNLVQSLDSLAGVQHVQRFALMPGILESESIEGVVVKGVTDDFSWKFFDDKLVEGKLLNDTSLHSNQYIIISKTLASRLSVELNDKITLYLVRSKEDIKPRTFRIAGLFQTGLDEFDRKFVLVDMDHIQRTQGWGLEAQIRIDTTCASGYTAEGLAFGGDGNFDYHWTDSSWFGPGPHAICPKDGERIELIVSDQSETFTDTAKVKFNIAFAEGCCSKVNYELSTSGGSYLKYTGGYEIFVDDFDKLEEMDEKIYHNIPFFTQTRTVKDLNPEIFNWLEMLDLNVYIIIGLMVFISVINMTSALLIIILERTQMIGLLKAMGATDGNILEIFLRNAGYIVGLGLLLGNVLGIGVCVIQAQTGFISLDPTTYFVDQAPILIEPMYIILLDVFTLVVCLLFLILPGMYVSRISPIKAIRFD